MSSAWEEREHYTDIYTSRALVKSNGDVIWNNAVTWRISCGVNIMWFPVDRQVRDLFYLVVGYKSKLPKLSLSGVLEMACVAFWGRRRVFHACKVDYGF